MEKSKAKYWDWKNILFPLWTKGKKEKKKEESYFYHEIKQKMELLFSITGVKIAAWVFAYYPQLRSVS